jgi:hypothetical protein
MSAANKRAIGPPPGGMKNPHRHHIVREKAPKNWKQEDRQAVLESQKILERHNIDINRDPKNFTWAPNDGSVHSTENAHKVRNILVRADAEGGRDGVLKALTELGGRNGRG